MLVVETDFFEYHRGSQAFEDDHEREFSLRGMGYIVRRYTGAQLDSFPADIAVELREVLTPSSQLGFEAPRPGIA